MITIYGLYGDGFSVPLENAIGLRELRMHVWNMIDEDARCPYWKQIRLMKSYTPEAETNATMEDAKQDEWTILRTDDDVLDLEDGAVLRYIVADIGYHVFFVHAPAENGHHWVAANIKRRVFRIQGIVEAIFPGDTNDEPEPVYHFYFHYCPYRAEGEPVFLIGGETVDRNDDLHMFGHILGHGLDVVSETGGWVSTLAEVVDAKCIGVVRREEREELVRAWSSIDLSGIIRHAIVNGPTVDTQAIHHRIRAYRHGYHG